MLRRLSRPLATVVVLASVCSAGPACLASAFLQGAYYRLGDADPGAAAGAVGNNPTLDSFAVGYNLGRSGSPHYAADVPALGPVENKLSMAFANIGLGGPAFPGQYGRSDPLPVVQQGVVLEAWVKPGPTNLDAAPGTTPDQMVAYNGDPAANGFGFFVRGDHFVARVGGAPAGAGSAAGGFEQDLGPAPVGEWHHVAYVYSLGTSTFYYDGKPVAESLAAPAPLVPAKPDGFWLAGRPASGPAGVSTQYPFNGWIDEVRYQSFNPIAAGAFEPTAFLITPEPSALCLLPVLGAFALRRIRRGGFSR